MNTALSFQIAVMLTIQLEGGFINDPKDPGGVTKYGISQRAYPSLDIPSLTRFDAVRIYYTDYWLRVFNPTYTDKFNIILFDTAVHLGVRRTKSFLRKISDQCEIRLCPEPWLIEEFLNLRIQYYKTRPKRLRDRYLKGWMNRVEHLEESLERSVYKK